MAGSRFTLCCGNSSGVSPRSRGATPAWRVRMMSSFLASESVREIVKRNMHEGRKTIAEVVAAGQERGEIDPRLDTEEGRHAASSSLNGNRAFVVAA